MKRRMVTLVATGACAALTVVAGATGPVSPPANVPQDQVAALSGIDLPLAGERGKELIESSFCMEQPVGCTSGQPVDALIAVAGDQDADPGVRIRAYRALGLYEDPEARAALSLELSALSSAQPGTDQLYLRAAIEALGENGLPGNVTDLTPFLDFEPSRDIRAAAADALRRLGCHCSSAIDALNARLAPPNAETSDQVILAIQRALRELSQ